MKEVFDTIDLYHGDCLKVLPTLEENSVHSVVTDPPYHLLSIVKRFGSPTAKPVRVGDINATNDLKAAHARAAAGFMGKRWDGGNIGSRIKTWKKVKRVLRPGGYLIAFGGTRTWHRMVCAIEDAGFDIRDTIGWVYGSGFPKSHDVSKGIDREAGVEREIISTCIKGKRLNPGATANMTGEWRIDSRPDYIQTETIPVTEAAQEWEGWGTALKPAMELIVLARKPLSEKTVAANVLKWGTGGLNIDRCRIGVGGDKIDGGCAGTTRLHNGGISNRAPVDNSIGRWPANFIHDGSEEVLAAFPDSKSCDTPSLARCEGTIFGGSRTQGAIYPGEDGSAARFFYQAKADASDRLGSKHPTVKPLDLMQYLVRLVTPKGGIVLDPFAGTGATGEAAYREGMRSVLIEMEEEYIKDIKFRIQCFNMTKKERKHTASIRDKLETPKKEGSKLYQQRGPRSLNS